MNSDTVLRGYYMAARGRVDNTPTREDISLRALKNISWVSAANEWNIFQQFNLTPKFVCVHERKWIREYNVLYFGPKGQATTVAYYGGGS